MKINSEVLSIKDLNKYFFVVPDYQREYVWESNKQITQFIDDIEEAFNSHSTQQNNNYFIGSIIIVKNGEKFDVIDGQQRLTTIVLSLCAIRNILEEAQKIASLNKPCNHILKLICDWLFIYDADLRVETSRLELQYEESNGFLEALIQKDTAEITKTNSVDKMQSAYLTLYQKFKDYITNDSKFFENFIHFFVANIKIVVIESDNLGSALKIFETINQRGVGLNAMDLVKNLMFSKASPNDFDTIKQEWKYITKQLQESGEGDNPLRFLRYFMIARYHNGIITEDDLYQWIISKEGKQKLDYEANPLKLVKEISLASSRYSELVQATMHLHDKIGYSKFPSVVKIGYINKIWSRQHLMLLLALDLKCNEDVLNYTATQIESFLFFANTLKLQTKSYEGRFTDWAIKLRGKKTIEEVKTILLDTMIPYIRNYLNEFKNTFSQIKHNDYNPQYRERYILGALENQIRRQTGLPEKSIEDFRSFQIEHILPQTIVNREANAEFADKDTHTTYTYRIGNTTLLESSINQAINNFNHMESDWFNKKQAEYLKSDIISAKLLNPEYSIGKTTGLNSFNEEFDFTFDKWSIDAIEKRQNLLRQLALENWTFDGKRLDEYEKLIIEKEEVL